MYFNPLHGFYPTKCPTRLNVWLHSAKDNSKHKRGTAPDRNCNHQAGESHLIQRCSSLSAPSDERCKDTTNLLGLQILIFVSDKSFFHKIQKKGRLPLRAASFINRRCFYRYWTAICLTVSGCWAFSFFGIWTFSTPCSTLASILSASASSGSRSVCWNFS